MAGCTTELPTRPVDPNPARKSVDGSFVSKRDEAQQVDKSFHKNKRPLTQPSDVAKTSRLTENKRRYRARRKEYVSDLERKLAEAREQGIKATTEVQLAARKVVAENGRLRELLRLAGFGDEDIDVWTRREDSGDSENGANFYRRREIEQRARLCVAFTGGRGGGPMEGGKVSCLSKTNGKRKIGQAGNISESTVIPSSTEEPLVSEPNPSNRPDFDTAVACPAPATSEAPAAAQVPVPPGSVDPLQDATYHGDVECGKAYEMLMCYVTSEEKMDTVARALEGGCTSTGNGGCAVKKNAIWEALDTLLYPQIDKLTP
ncbi:hypothetical protein DL767_008618 [Monosporascus sp. MG133]|nr:hypothetical protein DL767_008618 [Monosporascus sp. MG133]